MRDSTSRIVLAADLVAGMRVAPPGYSGSLLGEVLSVSDIGIAVLVTLRFPCEEHGYHDLMLPLRPNAEFVVHSVALPAVSVSPQGGRMREFLN
jgi:hypothetical protein